MPTTARVLLFTKIAGIALGLFVTAFTFWAQNAARDAAGQLAMGKISWELAKLPADATKEQQEAHLNRIAQKLTFDYVQEMRSKMEKESFVHTLVEYAPIKYLAILGGFCLVIGECWQFFRNPGATAAAGVSGTSALATIPGKASASATTGSSPTTIDIKIVT